MQNGKNSIQLVAGDDLSAAKNKLILDGGTVAGGPTAANILGALEANAAGTSAGEVVYVTVSGFATCLASETPPDPYNYVMSDASGRVETFASGGGNRIIGQYLPELRAGAAYTSAVENEEIRVYLFADKQGV